MLFYSLPFVKGRSQEIEQHVERLNREDKTPVEYGIDRDLERSF